MESLWRIQTETILPKENAADMPSDECNYDVIVIGAGMAGILIAFFLQEEGKNVLVLEADRIASGQTERTTAKITSQHALKYSKLIRQTGIDKARQYAQANQLAIREYEQLIERLGINCQFERLPAYLYTLKEKGLLEEEARAASSLGIDSGQNYRCHPLSPP